MWVYKVTVLYVQCTTGNQARCIQDVWSDGVPGADLPIMVKNQIEHREVDVSRWNTDNFRSNQ